MTRPQVRVGPSGPLATTQDQPLNDMVGAFFQALGPNPTNPPNEYLPGAIAAPSNEPYRIGRVGVGVPQDSTPPNANFVPLGLDEDINNFSMGVGIWLVESTISTGYNSTGPDDTGEVGDIEVKFFYVREDGSVGGKENNINSPITQPGISNANAGSIRSSTFRNLFEITQEDIDGNNGLPFKGFQVEIRRVDGVSHLVGSYLPTSGELVFTTDTNLSIKRYR